MRTVGELNQDVLQLEEFLDRQPHGAELLYREIEQATGVKMDPSGKTRLRQAAKRLKREHSCIHGVGIRLADADAVLPILSTKMKKIDKAVRRADRSHKNLQEQFFASLPENEQRKLLYVGALFGAIRLSTEQGRQMYRKGSMVAPTIHIPLPVMK